ncbi:hypothetical protein ACFL2H_00450 [Planctomycetota bacterium]
MIYPADATGTAVYPHEKNSTRPGNTGVGARWVNEHQRLFSANDECSVTEPTTRNDMQPDDDDRIDLSRQNDEVVIAKYEGVLERIVGSVAFVSLENRDGEEFTGTQSAELFTDQGIGDGDSFVCVELDVLGEVRFEIRPLTQAQPTAERIERIRRNLEQLHPDESVE